MDFSLVLSIGLIIVRIGAFIGGAALVGVTLITAIRQFVLPRSAPDPITRAIFLSTRRVFDFRVRKAETYEQRDAILALYAPLTLLVMPAVWLALVMAGYMLMFWALGVEPLDDAFLMSGSSLLTLGFKQPATLLTLLMAFSEAAIGLTLVALLIAYLPTIYAAFSKRETLVTLLEVRAGAPPSPITLFDRINKLDGGRRAVLLHDLWSSWEVWFVELEETHTSLGVLSFFRSQQPTRSWITSAGAVLDAASLAQSSLDIEFDPQASLTIRAGFLALRRIADFFQIPYDDDPQPSDPISIFREEYDEACQSLAEAGLPLKADREQAWRDFIGWRVNYDTVLVSLARLVSAPYAPWSSDRSIRGNRSSLFSRARARRIALQSKRQETVTPA